jgi:hypothetical protein
VCQRHVVRTRHSKHTLRSRASSASVNAPVLMKKSFGNQSNLRPRVKSMGTTLAHVDRAAHFTCILPRDSTIAETRAMFCCPCPVIPLKASEAQSRASLLDRLF